MPAIWAIADVHLSFGTPNKEMDVFGPRWKNHAQRIKQHWSELVSSEDLVLIPGDISWAKTLTEAFVDLQWIDQLPGLKVLLRGNHDYWWGSLSAISKILPPSLALIQNNSYNWNGVTIGGARLWDTSEYSFSDFITVESPPTGIKILEDVDRGAEAEKIFLRELNRLEMSLRTLNPDAAIRIAMTHYPPIGASLQPSRASELLEKYRIDICVFGHLHNVTTLLPFGERNGVRYFFTACDYLECKPLKILQV